MRGFSRQLPRPLRWLWYAILAVIAAELAFMAVGLAVDQSWFWTALQLSSISVGPLTLALLVVLVAGIWANRPRAPAEGRRRPPQGPGAPPEIAVARRTSQALITLARSRQGRVAIRRTARLVRAVRAAARPAPGPTAGDEPEEARQRGETPRPPPQG